MAQSLPTKYDLRGNYEDLSGCPELYEDLPAPFYFSEERFSDWW